MVRVTAAVCLLAFLLGLPASLSAQLSPPTGLEASDGVYTRKVGLSWEHVRDAVLYEVFRSETSNSGDAVPVGTTPSIIFYDPTATAGQTYNYWVRAHSQDETSELSAPTTGLRAVGREQFEGFLIPLEPPPVPVGNPITGAKVYLGKTLFWDEQLSSTRTVACGTCHQPRFGSSDPRSASNPDLSAHPGADGEFGNDDDVIGSPGVPLNLLDGSYAWSDTFGMQPQVTRRKAQSAVDAAYSRLQFWDGRADEILIDPVTQEVVLEAGGSLEDQALHPLVDTTEMSAVGRSWSDIVARVVASKPLGLSPAMPSALAAWIGDRGYPELFAEAFGDEEITPSRIALAIATYERTLYSDRTPHDQAISEIRTMGDAEDRGSFLFVAGQCRTCHFTTKFTDHAFKNIGLRPVGGDEGRIEVTGAPRDRVAFKTPGLLNVAFRGPFMHNGSMSTLQEVVDFYNRGGDFSAPNVPDDLIQPLLLGESDKAALVAFMTNELTDPRVPAEAGPLFDRPMLYAESARVPELMGTGNSGTNDLVPQLVAIEPPFAGNTSFTVGLFDALPNATATLVIDDQELPLLLSQAAPGARQVMETEVASGGFTSAVVALPPEVGLTLFGRWYVEDPNATFGYASSQTFRVVLFDSGSATADPGAVATVSAASFAQGTVAPESLVSGFGAELAAFEAAAASVPLPTVLGGLSIVVKDSTGAERLARLIYASPSQVNYEVPAGTAPGEAQVMVLRGGVAVSTGSLQIADVAPSLFSANASGMGPAAAQALHVAVGGEQTILPVATFDEGAGEFVTSSIDLGGEGEEVYLILYGTGIRAGDEVTATVGGVAVEVLFSGSHASFVGLDQVNIRLQRTLRGWGSSGVQLTVNGVVSNVVRINIL